LRILVKLGGTLLDQEDLRSSLAGQIAKAARDGYEVVARVSVGIALSEPGKSADDILRNADVAMS